MIAEFDQSRDFDVGLSSEQAINVTTEAEDQQIDVTFDSGDSFSCSMGEEKTFAVDFGKETDADEYQGSYMVTPSNQTQILPTVNKVLSQNVVVNPIPSNYGLITWDGSTLTVS